MTTIENKNLIFPKIFDIIYIESEGKIKMFSDFDTEIQSDEIIPEEYDDWVRFCVENKED